MLMHISSVVKLHTTHGSTSALGNRMVKGMRGYGCYLLIWLHQNELWTYVIPWLSPNTACHPNFFAYIWVQPAKWIITLDDRFKLITINGRNHLAALACSKLEAPEAEEWASWEVLEGILATRKCTVQYLEAQWEEQKHLQLSQQSCMPIIPLYLETN